MNPETLGVEIGNRTPHEKAAFQSSLHHQIHAHLAETLFAASFNAHIRANKLSLGPECSEFRNQFLSFFITTTGHDNLSPLLCEDYCGGASNSR